MEPADEFLLSFSQPNFYFHAATAYNILRMKGAAVGKMDFIGSSHLVNVSSSVVLIWADKELEYARNSGFEYDPTKPDVKLIVAKQRYYPWEGIVGLYRHKSCRLLCNNSQRMYRPFTLKEKKDDSGRVPFLHGDDFDTACNFNNQ